jgi:hypothetical protein
MALLAKATHALRYFLLRRLPTCKQMVAVMSESMERRLSLRERIVLRVHLWICAWCAWYLEQLHLLRDTLRLRAEQLPEDDDNNAALKLSLEARERIKHALRDQDA